MKSWDKVAKLAKMKKVLAEEMEALGKELIIKANLMSDLTKEQFAVAPEVDTLLVSSPCSPTRMHNDFKRFLIQEKCPWEMGFFGPEMKSFVDEVELGNDWILKMRPAKQGKTQDLL